jgi:DNA polymerase-3 subunit delta
MRLRVDQLGRHLEGPLAPVYLLGGDEPLQIQESRDAIRTAARKAGFDERVVLNVETGFDWSTLKAYADSLSLFGERRIIDVRLTGGKPGEAGARALRDYAAAPPEDNLLIVSLDKFDRGSVSTQWYKALDGAGVAIRTWPVAARELGAWIRRRAGRRGLKLTVAAAETLGERVEGNLLACAQEIDKLHMLHGEAELDVEAVLRSVADSARFDVFDLVDAALAGNTARSVRILQGLREEGVAPPLVAWALTREIRSVSRMAGEVAGGAPVDRVMAGHRVWEKRRALVSAALRRQPAPVWLDILRQAARADRIAKGGAHGRPWDALEGLALAMGGVMLGRGKPYNRPRQGSSTWQGQQRTSSGR